MLPDRIGGPDQKKRQMFEYFNDILCVQGGWLYSEGGIMSKGNYDQLIHRGWMKVIRRGCKGTPALIAYNTVPLRFRQQIMNMHGDPQLLAQRPKTIDEIVPDAKAIEFYAYDYKLDDGRNLPVANQLEYSNNAAILNAIGRKLTRRSGKRGAIGGSMTDMWESIAKDVERLKDDEQWRHSLPSDPRRLQERFKGYVKEGYTFLVHGNFSNANSRKVTVQIEKLILSLYCLPEKPFSSSVHDMYLQFLGGAIEVVDVTTGEIFDREDFYDKNGTPVVISDSTIWNYLNNPVNRAIIDRVRNDRHAYNNMHRPHHHRESPRMSLSKISMDDRDLPRKMHDGTYVKAYYAYDVASGVLLGAAYSRSKDTSLFVECMRDMFRTLRRLGLGVPVEVEVEHHLANKFKDDLLKAGVVFPIVQFCNPGNSQQKRAEHFNKAKKYGYEKRYQEGIGRWWAKQEANRPKQVAEWDDTGMRIKEKTFSFDDLVADDRRMAELYNNDLHRKQKLYKGMTRLDVLRQRSNPNAAITNDVLLARHIGDMVETTIRRNQYVRVKYADYQLESPEILRRLEPNNYTVQAYYLPEDEIESVYIYQKGEFLCECKKIVKYNEATAEQTDADRKAYTDQAKYVSQFDKMSKGEAKGPQKVKIINGTMPDVSIPEVKVIPISHLQQDPLTRPADSDMINDDDYYSARAFEDL